MPTPSRNSIIAEAGVNHNGDLALAKDLASTAAEAGADFVKFQSFRAEKLVAQDAARAPYQEQSGSSSQLQMLQELELSESDHLALWEHCSQAGIGFLSTPFDLESLDFLVGLGVHVIKVPSGEVTNFPFLEQVASRGLPVLLSTGMCTLGEVEAAVNVLLEFGCDRERLTLLHCTTSYPTPMEDANLSVLQTLRLAFRCEVGFSDHTLGIEASIAAVALGATVIEKHFTLDKTMKGPDHRASLDPTEFAALVTGVRNVEKALGTGLKGPAPSEVDNIVAARRSIHAGRSLAAGHVICAEDLKMKRPGSGISPIHVPTVVGSTLTRSLRPDERISWQDLAFQRRV